MFWLIFLLANFSGYNSLKKKKNHLFPLKERLWNKKKDSTKNDLNYPNNSFVNSCICHLRNNTRMIAVALEPEE